MTVPTMPAELSKILQSGFTREHVDTRYRLETETGPPSFRRRHAVRTSRLQGQIRVERGLTLRLDRFWEEIIGYGTSPFYMPDPLLDGRDLTDDNDVLLTDDNDVVLSDTRTLLCLMSSPHSVSAVAGDTCLVSLSLVVLP